MDVTNINRAADLLARHDRLQSQLNSLNASATTGLLELQTTQSNNRRRIGRDARTEVVIEGEALKIVTDLIGSLLSRQIDDINAELGSLGVTETAAADQDKAKAEPETESETSQPEEDAIFVVNFGFGGCDCPTCRQTRA